MPQINAFLQVDQLYCQAEFADGFLVDEVAVPNSPFEAGRNWFYDILYKRYEPEHGALVRFTLVDIPNMKRTDVEMSKLPANTRPVLYRYLRGDDHQDGSGMLADVHCTRLGFGYQYTAPVVNEEGVEEMRNHQEIIEVA